MKLKINDIKTRKIKKLRIVRVKLLLPRSLIFMLHQEALDQMYSEYAHQHDAATARG